MCLEYISLGDGGNSQERDPGERPCVGRTKRWLERQRKMAGDDGPFQAGPGPPLCKVLWLAGLLGNRIKPELGGNTGRI